MKTYTIKANYKGTYYQGPVDTRTEYSKTLTAEFDTIDKICEWLTKNPTYDNGYAYCDLISFEVFEVERTKIDNDKLLSMKETQTFPCYIHHAYSIHWECKNQKCPFFEQCLRREKKRYLSKDESDTFLNNKLYEYMDYRQRAIFQLETDYCCMPFDVYKEAVEKTLGRPVDGREFSYPETLKIELYKNEKRPNFEEMIGWIPKEKWSLIRND